MLNVLKGWLHRYLSDQEAVVLLILLIIGFTVILTMGRMLAPALAALVLAYLMQGLVSWLERQKLSHTLSVNVVFSGFFTAFLLVIFVVMPLIWEQVTQLLNALPNMVREGLQLLKSLPEMYPGFVSEHQVALVVTTINQHLADIGQWAFSFSISKLPGILALLVYVILIPILVFFFLKDKDELLHWMAGILPRRRRLIDQVADEMNGQIANYIRGKAVEIMIVGGVSYAFFAILGLSYSALLAVLVGFSVVVPYIGATVVTLPVAVIGFFQWGATDQFAILMIGYGIIQALDGNVLVPLLFSEAVNLHPVAIIVAVLVFGGFWGFWGVFFAIPLATLLKAVMNAWPAVEEMDAGAG
ncbi:AI-2E family transporter [uncultured Endozoicomonas sp.]|uniref:AI-2E family transporter n=1 Tax=uncultured Endozoicomonas sp. TaxID=432652 RepID=UPI00260B36FD|nr:AI-2E family transporter [uncultured Endozoicomonas sp.]